MVLHVATDNPDGSRFISEEQVSGAGKHTLNKSSDSVWNGMEQMLSFGSLKLQVNASNITNINLKYSTNDRLNTNLYIRTKPV